jgi:simple sugar transport system permease protein
MNRANTVLKIAVPIISVIIAFVIGGIIILALGKNPLEAYSFLLVGSFGSAQRIAQTLEGACPLIFTGLAATFAYKCGVFNLGGEGQFIMGAVASISFIQLSGMEGLPAVILSILLGAVAGGIWGAIPGLLKVTRGLNEMIVSIMLNYVATLFMGFIFTNLLREAEMPQTAPVPDSTKLIDISEGLRAHVGIIIALVVALAVFYFLKYTSKGFQLRAVGMNALASKVNGYYVGRLMLFSFIVSGAIAGMGGSIELHGKQFRLLSGFGSGFGFDGVAIALIAQLNPIATVIVAFFFAVLRKGASALQTGMAIPTSVVDIIQALIIVFAVAGTAILRLPAVKQFLLRMKKEKKEA